jgi:hypothetical protein
MDEHGIALGVCANRIVLGASNMKKHHTYIQSPENCERVFIISAIGHYIYPLVMFNGKKCLDILIFRGKSSWLAYCINF